MKIIKETLVGIGVLAFGLLVLLGIAKVSNLFWADVIVFIVILFVMLFVARLMGEGIIEYYVDKNK